MPKRVRKKLNISCTDADCESKLHCFKPTQKIIKAGDKGKCRYCGADLVDWSRVHKKEILDAKYTFKALKNEFIRHEFFHKKLTEKAKIYASKKGYNGLRKRASEIIEKHVSPTNNPYDGRQTPISNSKMNTIHFAQHATATCCRKCVEYWHGISQETEMTQTEKDYLLDLIMLYIDEKIPELNSQQKLNL